MFGMSLAEIGVILVLALVVLGPDKIPELARTMGKTLREVRKAGNMLRDTIMLEDELRELKQTTRSIASDIKGATNLNAATSRASTTPIRQDPIRLPDDLDDFDGPLDGIEDDYILGGSMTYDPGHGKEPTLMDVSIKTQREPSAASVTVVELAPMSAIEIAPPMAHHTSPFDVPHVDVREVFIHEQNPV